MLKEVRKVRQSFQKLIKLDKAVVKPGQGVLLRNFTKNTAGIFYRQGGKSFFNFKIQDAVVFDPDIDAPSTLIMCPTKDQTMAIYGPYFIKNYGKLKHEGKKVMTYRDGMSMFVLNRSFMGLDGTGYVEVGGCGSGQERSAQAKRGRTKHIILADEYGDWPPEYFDSVLSSQADVHDAPHFKTGTAKAGILEDDFLAYEAKMLAGDSDYFALKWTILHALKYGEVTQEFVDKKYEYYASRNQLAVWEAEYMLNFKAYLKDRPFADGIVALIDSRKVADMPLPSSKMVDTFWDLGVNGTTCWIRYSTRRGEHVYLKYLEQMENAHFGTFIEEKLMPYIVRHGLKIRYNVLPADGKQREFMSLNSRLEEARKKLPGTVIPLPVIKSIDDAIDYTKGFLKRCLFDKNGCSDGIRRLELYEYKGKGVPKDRKIKHHHAADAFIVSAVFDGDALTPGLMIGEKFHGMVDSKGLIQGQPQDFDEAKYFRSREDLTNPLRGLRMGRRNWGY